MIVVILLAAGLILAYGNGANDNFKGVATLFGSATARYRGALVWATLMTLTGSFLAVWLAQDLAARFTGETLVADSAVAEPAFLAAVAGGAALTVLIATRLRMPVSTTHALVGALIGAGLADSSLNWPNLGEQFLIPLLASPLIACIGTGALHKAWSASRSLFSASQEACLCVGAEPAIAAEPASAAALQAESLKVVVDSTRNCERRFGGRMLKLQAHSVFDAVHYLSAGLVSLARGLNDTPKIAALLWIVPGLATPSSVFLCGLVIAVGGLIGARPVAETMSWKITPMNSRQGLSANFATALLVVGASGLALPVSTTHVSCGALFGLGAITGQARWNLIGKILLAWMATLPVACLLSWVGYRAISR